MTTRETHDASFLNNPYNWQMWPRCAVKRGANNEELGVAWFVPEGIRVYVMNLFDKPTSSTPFTDYPNGSAVVAAGWKVD